MLPSSSNEGNKQTNIAQVLDLDPEPDSVQDQVLDPVPDPDPHLIKDPLLDPDPGLDWNWDMGPVSPGPFTRVSEAKITEAKQERERETERDQI